MSDTVHGPWEQAENSDYDEQKPGSADSHEDEYDDEYGEQQPKGDPNQPDNKLEEAHQADIEHWEEIARLNAMAKPYDPDAPVTADPPARPYDPDAPVIVSEPAARPYDPDAPVVGQPSSLDPNDFDRADSVDPGDPPTPGSAAFEPAAASTSSVAFDPAVTFADASRDEPYEPVIVDPGPDTVASSPDAVGSAPFDTNDLLADTFSLSSPLEEIDSPTGETDTLGNASFDPALDSQPALPEQTDWTDFSG